jgi:hypothetical protein
MVTPHRLRQYEQVNRSKTVRRRSNWRHGYPYSSVFISQPRGTCGTKNLRMFSSLNFGQG